MTDTIFTALVKAQAGFAPALKTSSNPHFKSRYADLAAVVEAVIDSLNANGIFMTQKTLDCESGVKVETIFIHQSGESMSMGVISVPVQKHDAQGYGSALTYARRYGLMAACGVAPEDDDGNAATANAPKPAPKKLAQPKERQPYSAESFEKNIESWAGMIVAGTAPESIIAKIESAFTLTDDQKSIIKALGAANDNS
jgi:hypothetical protein